jgi:hypothetical protein
LNTPSVVWTLLNLDQTEIKRASLLISIEGAKTARGELPNKENPVNQFDTLQRGIHEYHMAQGMATLEYGSLAISLPYWCVMALTLSRYELNSRCSNNVSCSMERAISGYIEPVKWWYQLIDNDNNAFYVQ